MFIGVAAFGEQAQRRFLPNARGKARSAAPIRMTVNGGATTCKTCSGAPVAATGDRPEDRGGVQRGAAVADGAAAHRGCNGAPTRAPARPATARPGYFTPEP